MNFYIDFEATQFNNKIISIGCVNDLGDTFYSLVKPKEGIKITKFITQLTGITKEMIDNALSADEVFKQFGDFISKHNDGQPTFFFCYGKTDSLFLTSTAKYIKNRDTKNFMNCLAGSLIDYSVQTQEFFKASVGVNKALNYFRKEPIVQKHDALEDAEMLRELYWYINTAKEEVLEECPFEECGKSNKNSEKYEGAVVSEGDKFDTLDEAVDFVLENLMPNNGASRVSVKKKIRWAINNNKEYFLRKWKKGE